MADILFIFAHYDDEFFVLPRLKAELAAGNVVSILYTTDSGAKDIPSSVRLNESLSVLVPLGISATEIISLGADLGVRDGKSHFFIDRIWAGINNEPRLNRTFDRIYTMAWEGGHVDHDVAHLLGIALAKKSGAHIYEFSAYHARHIPGPFFWCMSFGRTLISPIIDRLTMSQAFRWFLIPYFYKSQRKTFLGLLPCCLLQILIRRTLVVACPPALTYGNRPHQGPLLYEKLFHIQFEEFATNTAQFITRVLNQ